MRTQLTLAWVLLGSLLQAQTYLPLSNNLILNSNDNVKIIAGEYAFQDPEADGVIRLLGVDNVVIDGDSVTVDGSSFEGYFIYIEDCSNITIRNFELAGGYFYAVYAFNSSEITIENCTFSGNKRDDEGWIVIFEGPEGAHGGGVFMNQCSQSTIQGNTMQDQNDGVALYQSDHITLSENNLSWNTSYGIRMYHTHYCTIQFNDCSHINRPLTDPSDCAAILLLDCYENTVSHNNFTYSGDGIFLNQYNTQEPANNYFAYNDCSFSPHNAIEAVFSDGNVFQHNTCNFSNYGFWLGYSYNTVVDSNEIRGNGGLDGDGGGGIAIDRGYNNQITGNTIQHNSHGVKLWEGGLIAPYTNPSQDYLISGNHFYGNHIALSFANTANLTCEVNTFDKNYTDIRTEGNVEDNLISQNSFGQPVRYYFENHSPNDIQAPANGFPEIAIPGYLDCKIYDAADAIGPGFVQTLPINTISLLGVVSNAPSDLCEPPAVWDAYRFVEDGALTSISWDNSEKVAGDASVFLDTESGWDVHVYYFPGPNQQALWKLDESGSIQFWMKIHITDPDNFWGVQESFVRIGDICGNYYQYTNDYFQETNPAVLNNALDQWTSFDVPLSGNTTWLRTGEGTVELDSIAYISFNVDVWEYGYELWLDSVSVPAIPTSLPEHGHGKALPIQAYPNPTPGIWTIEMTLPEQTTVAFDLYDQQGRRVISWGERSIGPGQQQVNLDAGSITSGLYFLELRTGGWRQTLEVVR